MATELLPVVDLRGLSQSDLDALAAASAHALAPRSCPDADPLQPLKIDRAVFNESAGSRKQTFSRLRLAAASSSSPSARPTPSSALSPSARNDPESRLVAYHLRRLFAPDDTSLPPPPEAQTLDLAERSPSPPPDPDRETTNAKGVSVDLVRLAGMADPYAAELRRRTAGLASETELMGFISSLAGRWVSQRQRRKYVDASFFGDHLPSGWKLQLGLKRKERMAWVHCFSYVSPKGNQFATCKEASAYLMSLLGYPETKTVAIQYDNMGQQNLCAQDGGDDAVGFQHHTGPRVDNSDVLPAIFVTDERNVDTINAYECQKCNLTFSDQASYMQHHMSSHEMSAKRRRTGKFGEPVVGKDGKFECPVCLKTFAEESRYFGHVGAHARYEGMTPEAFLNKISSGKVGSNSLAEVSFTLQELTESPGQNNNMSAGGGCQHRSGSNEHGGNSGFQHWSGSNEHGSDSSNAKELFRQSCLDNLNRPSTAWRRPEEFPSIPYAPSSCNVTVSKVASRSSGYPDGSISGLSDANVFSDQVGSQHVFRPNAFGTVNHFEGQIIDHGMAASKHGDISNSVKARDVNLNSCLDINCESMVRSISFPIASANNDRAAALNEANMSSFTAKCFNGSSNNSGGGSRASSASTNKIGSSLGVVNKASVAASTCFGAGYGNDNVVKANIFGNKDNTLMHQSNMGMRPVSPVKGKADCFASRSVQSENSGKQHASNTKDQMDNIKSRASIEDGFGIESYNNNAFGGGFHQRGFSQFSNSFTHIKPNVSANRPLPESNTMKAGNMTKGSTVNLMKGSLVNRSDVNCMRDSSVNRSVGNNESNVSMHEVMGKSCSKMQNRYSDDCAPGCVPLAAASNGQNMSGLMSMQTNFGSMPSMVHSVGDAPRSSTTQDQCDLQLGFGAQKQQIFSGYGELRSTTGGSPQLSSMPRDNSSSTGSSQFGSMDRSNSFPTGSPQFGSLARPNFVPTSFQFGIMARPNSVPPAESSPFGSMPGPHSAPQAKSSQFGSMARPYSVPPADSQFGSTARPNSVPLVDSSQFGSMVSPNGLPPESSQFGSMARQIFVSRTEPTLVLGYAPQMGDGPPVQVGWDMSSSKVSRGMMTCVCISCNSQFHHFGSADGHQPVSFDLICPACKDRVSGHRIIPNNGSWHP
ncbi:hypothetical protein ACP70R_017664 [Stipagrostis hirtigluma subsp. patula]